jgi:hypothetical protein
MWGAPVYELVSTVFAPVAGTRIYSLSCSYLGSCVRLCVCRGGEGMHNKFAHLWEFRDGPLIYVEPVGCTFSVCVGRFSSTVCVVTRTFSVAHAHASLFPLCIFWCLSYPCEAILPPGWLSLLTSLELSCWMRLATRIPASRRGGWVVNLHYAPF